MAEALPTAEQRLELVELMVTLEMLCDSIPAALEASIEHWAGVLWVEDRSLRLARDLAAHASAQALHDFYRYDWVGEQDILSPAFEGLLARHGDKAYALTVEPDPLEASRWRALEHCPAGSIGRSLWDFYQERCFGFPGEPGAANAALAHHDWIHVLADFDTSPMGEMEVTAFQAAASTLPGATLGFIGAVSIFQTGLLPSLVVPPGYSHALEVPGGPERIADAIQRGRACQRDVFREIDFFAVADQALPALREGWSISGKANLPTS